MRFLHHSQNCAVHSGVGKLIRLPRKWTRCPRKVVEVNLVAQDLTTYGTDLPFDVDHPDARPSLANLLRRIGKPPKWVLPLTICAGFGCITPIQLQRRTSCCRDGGIAAGGSYIDCPLQHIDDKLLKLMRRGYTGKSVYAMVGGRKHLPDCFCARRLSLDTPVKPMPRSRSCQRLCAGSRN